MLKMQYAFFKRRIHQQERVRVERKYADIETIPSLTFVYEWLHGSE